MRFQHEKTIRKYLLGTLPQTRAERLEERLLTDDELAEKVSLIEDELIEDYARDALNPREREQFKNYFLVTPKRHQKLMTVRGLRNYALETAGATVPAPRRPWYVAFLIPQWKPVAALLLIVAVGGVVWRTNFYRDDVDKGLQALTEAYKVSRPVQARVTGIDYSPFSATRGPGDVNSRELDRSAALLHNAVSESPSTKALHALGRLYLLNRDFDKAIQQFEEALKASPNDPRLHSDLGAALLEKGRLERATDQSGRSETTLALSLTHLSRALELDDSLPDARFNRALLYEEVKLTPQAIQDWEKYLSLDSKSRWAAEARTRVEELRKQSAQVSKRDQDLFEEFQQARKNGEEDLAWRVFAKAHLRNGNSITNKLIDEYLDAATNARSEAATQSLQTLTQLGKLSRDKSGDLLNSDLAEVYRTATPAQQTALLQARKDVAAAYDLFNRSKPDQAIPLYDRAKTVFEQAGDYPESLLASFWIGFCFTQKGDTQKSLSLFEEVEAESKQREYKWLRSLALIGLANGESRKAQYSNALENSWNSYRMAAQTADENGALRSLNMIASLYRSVGNYRLSLHMAQQGLGLGTKISADPSQMTGFYATSAWNLNSLGYYAAALEFEKQALNLAEQMNSPLAQSRYHVQMGQIHGMLKNYGEAVGSIRKGIEIGESVGEEAIRDEMRTYGQLFLGRIYRESKQFDEALTTLAKVESFCEGSDNQLWLLHEVKKEQLLSRIAQGEVVAAREELGRVIAAYEEQRKRIREESNRSAFFAKEQSIYDVAVDFLLSQLSDPQQAFDYSENSRARSLLDTGTNDWQVGGEEGRKDLQFSSASKPLPLEQLRPDIPPRSQLLQFAVLRDKLIIWYLTSDRFEHATVSVSGDELLQKVDRLLALITKPANDDSQLRRVSAQLYQILITPLAQFLDQGKQLCIVPDKILNLLPFNVLFSPSSQRYLIEDFALSYASSANLFVRDSKLATEKPVASERLLGVGNPSFDRNAFPELADLPTASREVEEIKEFYAPNSSLLRGPEAKKGSVLGRMRDADVLHLATHYLPDATSPMLSKLVLAGNNTPSADLESQEDVLRAYEVYRLKPLRARLAVLAGCRTGVEAYVNGEGPIGLARPFNAAGVPLVVASLWPVDSAATTELMIEFHRLRKRNALSTAQALRAAQMQMLRNGNASYRSPYYWASFSVTGGYSDY